MKIEDALKQKNFESPQIKVWANLIYTHNVFNELLSAVFKEYDITHQQYNVLRILKGRLPDSASCTSVRKVMLDRNPDLTRLCDRLIGKGLIKRETNEHNRREIELKIMPLGIDLLKRIDPKIKDFGQRFNALSDEEAQQFSDLLDKLRG